MIIPHAFNEKPFPHLVIDDAVNQQWLTDAYDAWPSADNEGWKQQQRGKRCMSDRDKIPLPLLGIIDWLNGPEVITQLKRLSGISDLIADHNLSGGGLHEIEPGGSLGMHVDFNRLATRYRRVNVLLYLNPGWKDEWGGHLLLWDLPKNAVEKRKIAPVFNRLVIFESTDQSWHGHPTPLLSPDGVFRRSIATYYYSEQPPATYKVDHSTVYNDRKDRKMGLGALKPK